MTPLPKRPEKYPDPYILKIERILVQGGISTHRSVRRMLTSRTVCVNGQRVTSPSHPVDTRHDTLSVNGKAVSVAPHIYLMLNKAQDTVCSTVSGMLHRSVLEGFPPHLLNPPDLPPLHIVGRLDADTEGLLLLTTDGCFSHFLTDPEKHIPKTYLVYLRDSVPPPERDRYAAAFAGGITVPPAAKSPEFTTKPAELQWSVPDEEYCTLDGSGFTTCTLTVTEGKFHQVKRMFRAVGNEVIFLKRIAMGNLYLDKTLLPGKYRPLSDLELQELMWMRYAV